MATAHKNYILYVDDEQENLDGFQYSFRKEYDILTALSGADALEILKKFPVKVILSDQRMPDMKGTEFLEIVTAQYPDIIRIILTAFTDIDDVLGAINKGQVYRYLLKPWDKNELKITIGNALDSFNLKQENKKLIEDLRKTNSELTASNEKLKTEIVHRKKIETKLQRKHEELITAEEEIRSAYEEIRATNDELSLKNVQIKTTLKQLKSSEEKYRLLIEGQTDLIVKIDPKGQFLFVSPSFCEMVDKSEEYLAKNNFFSFVIDEDKNKAHFAIDEIHDKANTSYVEQRTWTKHGIRWIAWANKALFDQGDKINEIISVGRDITKQKETQTALQQSENRFRTFFEQAADGIIVGIASGIISDVNTSVCKITGYNKDEIIGKNIAFLFPKEILKEKPLRYDLVNKGESVIVERNIICKDGSQKMIEMNTQKLNNGQLQAFIRDISYRKKAELELRQANDIFNNLQTGIYVYQLENIYDDKTLRMIAANPASEKLTGVPTGQAIGKTLDENFPGLRQKGIPQMYAKVVLEQKQIEVEDIYYSDERVIAGAFSLKAFPLPGNRVGVSFENITKRKLAENALKISENRLSFALKATNDGLFDLNIKTDKNYFSPRYYTMLGYSPDEFPATKKSWEMLVHPDDLQKTKAIIHKHWENKLPSYDAEFRMKTKSGQWKWIQARGKVVERDTKGEVLRMVGTHVDITERKNTSIEIEKTNHFLHGIIEASPDVIFISNITTDKIEFVTSNIEQITGISVEDIVEIENISTILFPPDQREKLHEHNKRIIEKGHSEVELQIVKSNKKKIWVRISAIAYQKEDEKGYISHVLGQVTEITKRKIAERALIESEVKFRNIFNSSNDAIIISDENLFFLEFNDYFKKLLRYNKISLSHKTFLDIVHPLHTQMVKEQKNFIFARQAPSPLEIDFINQEGQLLPVEINSKLIEYNGQQAMLTIARNISERKQMEQKLFDTMLETEEKERERLAGDLHDEIGPILSSMKMYINTLHENVDKKKQRFVLDQLLVLTKEAIINVRAISNALSPHILSNYGLSAAINSALQAKDFITVDFKNTIDNSRFPSNIEIIYYRIINELLNNTIKHANAKLIQISLDYDDNLLKLRYSDDGKGFDFEEKMKNKRSGIGLLNIMSRIKTIKGKYEIDTSPGKGFHFMLETPSEKLRLQKESTKS